MKHRYPTRFKISKSSQKKIRKKCSEAVLKERKKSRRKRNTAIQVEKNDFQKFGYTPRRPRKNTSELTLLPNRKKSKKEIELFLAKKSEAFNTAVATWNVGDTAKLKEWYGRNISPHLKWMKIMTPMEKNPSVDTQQFKEEAWQSFLFGMPYVHVGDSEGRGKGVFASRTFGNDDIIDVRFCCFNCELTDRLVNSFN